MKKLLKEIIKDRENGLVMSNHQSAMIESEWLKIFGIGGCYYPDVTLNDMFKDLLDHYKV